MLKELLTFPLLAFFQPKELEKKLNEPTIRRRLVIGIHLLAFPVIFFANLIITQYFGRQDPQPSHPFIALMFSLATYLPALILALFFSGVFKRDNLTGFLIGTYTGFLADLLTMLLFCVLEWVTRNRASWGADYVDSVSETIVFIFLAVLFFLICAIVVNIYGKTQYFWIFIFVICLSSFIINYQMASTTGAQFDQYLYLTEKPEERPENKPDGYTYLLVTGIPKRTNQLWTIMPSTSVSPFGMEENILLNIDTGEQIPITNYEVSSVYFLDENTLGEIRNNFVNRLDRRGKKIIDEINTDLNDLRSIPFAWSLGSYLTNENTKKKLSEHLREFTARINDEYFYQSDSDRIESDYLEVYSSKFQRNSTIRLNSSNLEKRYAPLEKDEGDFNSYDKRYRGYSFLLANKRYSLNLSGYLTIKEESTDEILSERDVFASIISPLSHGAFYYVTIYYTILAIIIAFLGFFRIPIYLAECGLHSISSFLLARGWISPKRSTKLTPLFFDQISTISVPRARNYLNKLFSAAPEIVTEKLIYLLTKTNQKRFSADYCVDFFEKERNSLFEFIYMSLKTDEGSAISAILKNTKRNNTVTDLLRSYQNLIDQPQKKPYIGTHFIYLQAFFDESYKHSKEIFLSYGALSSFYKIEELQQLTELDKHLEEVLKINYGELLNIQIIEIFNVITEFAQDLKNYDVVEAYRDKQYYLSEARIKLYDLSSHARDTLNEPERSIFLEIFEKWQGIITAEAKSLRGPADIDVSILNKNFALDSEDGWVSIVARIKNSGQSPAENVSVALIENSEFAVQEKKKEIRLLGIGEDVKIEFSIKPRHYLRELRLNIDASFDDFERKNKLRVFADILSIASESVEYKKVSNPYIVGIPLRNDNLFVGRAGALKFALDNLSGGAQNNVLIYFGQRRIGKSSLLYQLTNSSLNKEYVFVYIDCQGFADADTARLLYRLGREIRNHLLKYQILIEEPVLDKFKQNTFLEFDDYLDKIESSLEGKKIALMFDEYEFLEYKVKEGQVSAELFNKLRNIMQHRNESFAFIFVGTHRLTELTENYWSFLFNIALYYEITTLNEDEARALIVKPIEDYIKYDELALEKILRITGNHPYFIQIICRLAVNYCNENSKGYFTLEDLNKIMAHAVDGGTAHVKYLFTDNSTKAEQEILTFLSRITDETKLFAGPLEIVRFSGENGFAYDAVSIQELLSGLKNKKLVRQGGEAGDLVGFEYEFLRIWIEKHVKIQRGFINVT